MSQNCSPSCNVPCEWWSLSSTEELLSIVQNSTAIIVALFVWVGAATYIYNTYKIYRDLSKAMKVTVQKSWFGNVKTNIYKYSMGSAITDNMLRTLIDDATAQWSQYCKLFTTMAMAYRMNFSQAVCKENPCIRRVYLRTLRCRPDPAIFSFLSLFSFTCTYVDIACEAPCKYRYGYYYDYSHMKPVFVRLKIEESLLDHVLDHLRRESIRGQVVDDPYQVDLGKPADDSGTTLAHVIFALHIPYVNGKDTFRTSLARLDRVILDEDTKQRTAPVRRRLFTKLRHTESFSADL